MKRLFLVCAAAALVAPAAASAHTLMGDSGTSGATIRMSNTIAKANQSEGRLTPGSCSAPRTFTVGAPSDVAVLLAGTNGGGHLWAQVSDAAGHTGDETGTFAANTPGTYSYRVCFRSGDGIDAEVQYVAALVVARR